MNTKQKDEDKYSQEETKKTQDRVHSLVSVVKSVILWIICAILVLLGLASIMVRVNLYFILVGVECLILAVLACPLITAETRDIPALSLFYRLKTPIVILFVISTIIFIFIAGASIA